MKRVDSNTVVVVVVVACCRKMLRDYLCTVKALIEMYRIQEGINGKEKLFYLCVKLLSCALTVINCWWRPLILSSTL